MAHVNLSVCDVLKVQHLMDKMVELFEVPYECQKIVHKG
jgi:hypothetical protein